MNRPSVVISRLWMSSKAAAGTLAFVATVVVVCEAKGTIVNTDDNESVSVRRLK